MKKVTVILLSFAMVFCGVFAGCAKQTAGYAAKLCASDSGYYNADLPYSSEEVTEPEEQSITYALGDDSLELTYFQSVDIPGRHVEEYTNEGNTIAVGRYADTGNTAYVIYSDGSNVISETLTTEAEYRAWVEDYLNELMPDEDLSQYDYICETSYACTEEDSLSFDKYDGFYIPQENEKINSYTFKYVKTFNGYKTYDIVGVTIVPYRSAEEPCKVVGVGYSNHEFDNFGSVNLNEQSVNAAVEAALRSAIKDGSYEFKSFEIENYILVYENGELGVVCGVSTTVENVSGITPEPDYPDDADPTPEPDGSDNIYTTYEMVFVSIPTSDYTVND